jgi:ABC-2 type transport system ATP-binding protein
VRRLSGGEQRLVSLAVTLVADRPVLILDEPTNELDPAARRRVWDHLRGLHAAGRTIVLVTHDVLEAERVIERVGLINRGRLMAIGRTADLKRRVAQRVRLEVAFADDADAGGYDPFADLLGDTVERIRAGNRTILLVPREEVRATLETLLDKMGIDAMADFRVLGPSLEDVYLQLGGSERLG